MKTLITLSILMSTSAFANITCKGAINYAKADVTELNAALGNGINFEDAKAALLLENGSHRDVILACPRIREEREEYCQSVPRALSERVKIIAYDFSGIDSERRKLLSLNEKIRELSRIICP